MSIEIIRFNLLSPLCYVPGENPDPFNYREGSGEKLFCFELDEAQYRNFEPDKTKLLENLIFGGKAAGPDETAEAGKTLKELPLGQLPQGHYLFAQKREILNRKDITDLAVEIQSEGLWQRLLPGEKLYLRYLFEDGQGVTQLFRPYAELDAGTQGKS